MAARISTKIDPFSHCRAARSRYTELELYRLAQLTAVYSETPRLVVADEPWQRRPAVLRALALAAVLVLNILFW
jgi:hypothetical protein